MKTLIVITTIITCFLIACTTGTKSDEASENKFEERTTECYAYTQNGDTVKLHLNIDHQQASGTLQYKLKEKDSNTGTFNGTLYNDTLLADYTFQSEGMKSVRQIAFLRKNNGLVEGYGEIEMVNDKAIFKNVKTLQFKNGSVLSKINCE